MVSAVAFTAAGIGATAWLLSADGDDATAARTDGADLERFETAAGARMPSQVAVVPRTTIADAAKMAAVAALTPPPFRRPTSGDTTKRAVDGDPAARSTASPGGFCSGCGALCDSPGSESSTSPSRRRRGHRRPAHRQRNRGTRPTRRLDAGADDQRLGRARPGLGRRPVSQARAVERFPALTGLFMRQAPAPPVLVRRCRGGPRTGRIPSAPSHRTRSPRICRPRFSPAS